MDEELSNLEDGRAGWLILPTDDCRVGNGLLAAGGTADRPKLVRKSPPAPVRLSRRCWNDGATCIAALDLSLSMISLMPFGPSSASKLGGSWMCANCMRNSRLYFMGPEGAMAGGVGEDVVVVRVRESEEDEADRFALGWRACVGAGTGGWSTGNVRRVKLSGTRCFSAAGAASVTAGVCLLGSSAATSACFFSSVGAASGDLGVDSSAAAAGAGAATGLSTAATLGVGVTSLAFCGVASSCSDSVAVVGAGASFFSSTAAGFSSTTAGLASVTGSAGGAGEVIGASAGAGDFARSAGAAAAVGEVSFAAASVLGLSASLAGVVVVAGAAAGTAAAAAAFDLPLRSITIGLPSSSKISKALCCTL